MTSTLPPLVQALSGAIGSASANTLTYPVDLATARLQLSPRKLSRQGVSKNGLLEGWKILRRVIRRYGVGALYDGMGTDTGATVISNFFYFYIYSFLRDTVYKHRRLASSNPKKKSISALSLPEELILGFLAGVASRAISTPLSIITLRLQTERDSSSTPPSSPSSETSSKSVLRADNASGIVAVVKKIYDEDGLTGFWKGFSTTALLCLNPSLTLSLFQVFRRILALTKRNRAGGLVDPTPGEAFIGGAVASSIASALLYPLILAKTRLQAARKQAGNARPSLLSVLEDAETKGELYQGLEMQILKGFVNQGVTFLVKGRIEQMIVNEYLRRRGLKRG
ncbi:hypothetical protein VNI00_011692 [Paramarasmius palmivorus]|uniref:Mitochondrial carrier n=1 Tax=Paramarasmius palmivorus TaxID=297713 RepID=A0AAW0CB06_9AGAR